MAVDYAFKKRGEKNQSQLQDDYIYKSAEEGLAMPSHLAIIGHPTTIMSGCLSRGAMTLMTLQPCFSKYEREISRSIEAETFDLQYFGQKSFKRVWTNRAVASVDVQIHGGPQCVNLQAHATTLTTLTNLMGVTSLTVRHSW